MLFFIRWYSTNRNKGINFWLVKPPTIKTTCRFYLGSLNTKIIPTTLTISAAIAKGNTFAIIK